MTSGVKVLGGVLVGRRIATKCNTARLAGAQMQPRTARPDAFFTYMFFCQLELTDGINMLAANGLNRHKIKVWFKKETSTVVSPLNLQKNPFDQNSIRRQMYS
jgi:hypothetical protein